METSISWIIMAIIVPLYMNGKLVGRVSFRCLSMYRKFRYEKNCVVDMNVLERYFKGILVF